MQPQAVEIAACHDHTLSVDRVLFLPRAGSGNDARKYCQTVIKNFRKRDNHSNEGNVGWRKNCAIPPTTVPRGGNGAPILLLT
ncbi:MAG TPA: hypothetical protein VMU26_12600 [Candidatus Polarisedimenticolia bacterium]|nr:hypothetical protein [Candidatus Polarisedimenticolia bacterium]